MMVDAFTIENYLRFPSGEARVDIVPENAKLNVNQIPQEDLQRLLQHLREERVRPLRAGSELECFGVIEHR